MWDVKIKCMDNGWGYSVSTGLNYNKNNLCTGVRLKREFFLDFSDYWFKIWLRGKVQYIQNNKTNKYSKVIGECWSSNVNIERCGTCMKKVEKKIIK